MFEGILPNYINSYPSLNVDYVLAHIYPLLSYLTLLQLIMVVLVICFSGLTCIFFPHPLISLSRGTDFKKETSQAPLHLISF